MFNRNVIQTTCIYTPQIYTGEINIQMQMNLLSKITLLKIYLGKQVDIGMDKEAAVS